MTLDFRCICRLCLAENDTLMPLFRNEPDDVMPTMIAKIKSFAPLLELFAGDGLPDQVCQKCVVQVDVSYKFKLQCENSDATLRKCVTNQCIAQNPHDILVTVLENDNTESRNGIKNEVKEEVEDFDVGDQRSCSEDSCAESSELWTNSKKDQSPPKKRGKLKLAKKQLPHRTKTIQKRAPRAKQRKLGATGKPGKSVTTEINDGTVLKSDTTESESVSDVKYEEEKQERKLFQCNDCGKDFAKKTQLALHMSGHTGAKPFVCPQCGRTFASRINLKKHVFTHTGQKPYLCTGCGISFGRIDTLTKHMRSHTGERPFHCNICGSAFARRSTFTNHVRTHSGEKPYLCTECGWRCVQSYDLKKHMRCHTGEKPYHCPACRMSFGQRNSLTKHMRCHPGEPQLASFDFGRINVDPRLNFETLKPYKPNNQCRIMGEVPLTSIDSHLGDPLMECSQERLNNEPEHEYKKDVHCHIGEVQLTTLECPKDFQFRCQP